MIGRYRENDILNTALSSKKAEFIAVYGRRRIGKTYLIKKYFKSGFSFYFTGTANSSLKENMTYFYQQLLEYGADEKLKPENWADAFFMLKKLLQKKDVARDSASGRRVIFLDELPWMDTPRSGFRTALDFFWNSWASMEDDICLIVCGSATSWIINHLIDDRGGFHNRVTRQIHMEPFTLNECRRYFDQEEIPLSDQELIEFYMTFGGVAYYMDLIDKRMSMAQNIDALIMQENGQLHCELDRLFNSLFGKALKHLRIVEDLAGKQMGLTREALSGNKQIGGGESLTTALLELEQCGFIRKYTSINNQHKGAIYQLIDPFTLFCLTFVKKGDRTSWMSFLKTGEYNDWVGKSFELVCLLHANKIKEALGIDKIDTAVHAWKSKKSSPGAQVDMLIDRADGVINLCEMKYSQKKFAINKDYSENLLNKIEAFQNETKTSKTIRLTFITLNGLAHNEYSRYVVNEITGSELIDNKIDKF